MTAAEKIAFAKSWFARGECPGCGAPLAKVAGQGLAHYRERTWVARESRWADLGDVIGFNGSATNGKPCFCSWTPDNLTSLVALATDFWRDVPESCEEVAAGSSSPTAAASSDDSEVQLLSVRPPGVTAVSDLPRSPSESSDFSRGPYRGGRKA